MVLAVDPERLRTQGEQLMELSSQLRRARSRLEAVDGALRRDENLQEVRRKLDVEMENLTAEMAKLAALSNGLQQIAEIYARCEGRCADAVDDVRRVGHGSYTVSVQPVDPNIFAALQ